MELKPGYKQTEVGVIPEEWEVDTLGEYATFRTGPFGSALHKSDYTNDGIPVINPMHIVDGRLIPTSTMSITERAAQDLADFRLKANEIIIGRRGDMGRCAVIQEEQSGWLCGTGSMIIRCGKGADPYFLQRILSSSRVISAIEETSVGSTMINLNQGTLSGLKLQFPPLPEQRAIAAALSDVDALIASLDKLIAKKRDMKQAAMQELLTGKRRLPGFDIVGAYGNTPNSRGACTTVKPGECHSPLPDVPHGWEVKRLGEVLTRVANGAVYIPTNSQGLAVTRIETIADGTINLSRAGYAKPTPELAKYKLQKGDILFSHINSVDHIGKVAIVPDGLELYHGMNLLLLRSGDSIDSSYLHFWLGSEYGRKKSVTLAKQAVSQASINTGELKGIEIPVPPLPEQTAIAAILSDMDTEIAALEQKRDKTRLLKQGMMQELLTGRIRLV